MNKQSKLFLLAFISIGLISCGGSGAGGLAGDISGSGSPIAISIAAKGTISGFGSVIVNGVHYETSATTFNVDDNPGSESDLAVGQIVTIFGTNNGDGTGTADVCIFESEVEGIVTSIDTNTNTIIVLGQTIIYDNTTVFEGALPDASIVGIEVEISGYFDDAGSIQASYIEARASVSGEYELKGFVANLDAVAERFFIKGLEIDYSGSSFDPVSQALEENLFVEVRGSLSAGLLIADEIEFEDEFKLPDGDNSNIELDIEGNIQSIESSSSFIVSGILVTYASSTEFKGGTATDLRAGISVDVEGTLQSDGNLLADEIDFNLDDIDNIEISAQIDSVDLATSTITILGQDFVATAQTLVIDDRDEVDLFDFEDLASGDWVEIDAAEVDGDFVLTKLVRKQIENNLQIQGPLDSFNELDTTLVILGITIDTSSSSYENDDVTLSSTDFYAALQIDTLVAVEGPLSGSILVAEETELED